jgi:hypothetical protein
VADMRLAALVRAASLPGGAGQGGADGLCQAAVRVGGAGTPVRPRAVRSRKNASRPAPSSAEVTCRPRISRPRQRSPWPRAGCGRSRRGRLRGPSAPARPRRRRYRAPAASGRARNASTCSSRYRAISRRRGLQLVVQKAAGSILYGRSPSYLLRKHCERFSKGSRGGRPKRLRLAHQPAGRSVHHLAGRNSPARCDPVFRT